MAINGVSRPAATQASNDVLAELNASGKLAIMGAERLAIVEGGDGEQEVGAVKLVESDDGEQGAAELVVGGGEQEATGNGAGGIVIIVGNRSLRLADDGVRVVIEAASTSVVEADIGAVVAGTGVGGGAGSCAVEAVGAAARGRRAGEVAGSSFVVQTSAAGLAAGRPADSFWAAGPVCRAEGSWTC